VTIYQLHGKLYCAGCVDAVAKRLNANPPPMSPAPRDAPLHCAECKAFVGASLTPRGFAYVRDRILSARLIGDDESDELSEWEPYYFDGEALEEGDMPEPGSPPPDALGRDVCTCRECTRQRRALARMHARLDAGRR
jgi:hypothetical protein